MTAPSGHVVNDVRINVEWYFDALSRLPSTFVKARMVGETVAVSAYKSQGNFRLLGKCRSGRSRDKSQRIARCRSVACSLGVRGGVQDDAYTAVGNYKTFAGLPLRRGSRSYIGKIALLGARGTCTLALHVFARDDGSTFYTRKASGQSRS